MRSEKLKNDDRRSTGSWRKNESQWDRASEIRWSIHTIMCLEMKRKWRQYSFRSSLSFGEIDFHLIFIRFFLSFIFLTISSFVFTFRFSVFVPYFLVIFGSFYRLFHISLRFCWLSFLCVSTHSFPYSSIGLAIYVLSISIIPFFQLMCFTAVLSYDQKMSFHLFLPIYSF